MKGPERPRVDGCSTWNLGQPGRLWRYRGFGFPFHRPREASTGAAKPCLTANFPRPVAVTPLKWKCSWIKRLRCDRAA
jgi:hypothetical protein